MTQSSILGPICVTFSVSSNAEFSTYANCNIPYAIGRNAKGGH